jgi:hypothetical protein
VLPDGNISVSKSAPSIPKRMSAIAGLLLALSPVIEEA